MTKPKPKSEQKKTGRPTLYNQELAAKICGLIAIGKPLRKVCEELGIDVSNIFLWKMKHTEFSEQYARAKEDQADLFADEIAAIADETPLTNPITGSIDSAAVQHQRLRVDARKWAASKLKPKSYGDRVSLDHSGKLGIESLIVGANDGSTDG